MTDKAGKDLDRQAIYRETKHLYSDPRSYKLYISKKDNAKLNQQIVDGEVKLTLQDLIDHGDDLLAE